MTTTSTQPGITYDGQYTTVTGEKFDQELDGRAIAQRIRVDIKAAVKAGQLPDWKYSVRRGHGYRDVDITVVRDTAWATVTEPADDFYPDPREVASPEARRIGDILNGIGRAYYRTTRDPYTDYYAGGFLFVYASTVPGGGLCL